MRLGVAIIGAGLIGRKRALAVRATSHSRLVAVVDLKGERARALADEVGGDVDTRWQRVVRRDDVDVVIVATINKFLAPIVIAALGIGKHVLCEKPLGLTSKESRAMIEAATKSARLLKPGFNHRYHKGIATAKRMLDQGAIGHLCFMRCRYGHGGRPGYQKEWRARKELSGGGELLDQGVHVVDLFRWFAGDFHKALGYTCTRFWEMDVEDNAFALFTRSDGTAAAMHTSWTQWKNVFSFEIFGSEGYLIVEGLGGSYGMETLRIGKRRPESGPPEERVARFRGSDISWKEEWLEFISALREGRQPLGNAMDGYIANKMIEAVYLSSKSGRSVTIG